jgi:hypothetical protein
MLGGHTTISPFTASNHYSFVSILKNPYPRLGIPTARSRNRIKELSAKNK